MKKKIDAIVVGELNVDLILNRIEGFPEVGKEKLAGEMTLTLGSSSAICASNLSSLGSKVSFLGKIGKDIFGDLVVESLAASKVQTDLIICDENTKTGATIVLNYDEDRAMITHTGAMETLAITDIRPEKIESARHLHFSSYFLQAGLRADIIELFRMAKQSGLTTSLDAQWDPDEKWDLDLQAVLPFVDIFLPNQLELLYLTGQADLTSALSYLKTAANVIVVKMGNEGSLLAFKDQLIRKPAFLNKEVVDAIGAGDSFNAGFIHKFLQGAAFTECQEFANLTGAVSTTAAGGTSAFLPYENFRKTAKDVFGYHL